jgi:hypothetical protein
VRQQRQAEEMDRSRNGKRANDRTNSGENQVSKTYRTVRQTNGPREAAIQAMPCQIKGGRRSLEKPRIKRTARANS